MPVDVLFFRIIWWIVLGYFFTGGLQHSAFHLVLRNKSSQPSGPKIVSSKS